MGESAYAVCNSQTEFLDEINSLDMAKRFYAENRQLFLDKYDAKNNGKYYAQIKTVLEECSESDEVFENV